MNEVRFSNRFIEKRTFYLFINDPVSLGCPLRRKRDDHINPRWYMCRAEETADRLSKHCEAESKIAHPQCCVVTKFRVVNSDYTELFLYKNSMFTTKISVLRTLCLPTK